MKPHDASILIIGTGFAGIAMAIRLKQAGITDFALLEREGDVGGTWRDNTYPGAACDVPSHLYSFSFAPNTEWTRAFAPQGEILAYLRKCVTDFDLGPHLRFNSGVASADFDERSATWAVTLTDGAVLRCRAIVAGCGGLTLPSTPNLPGLDTFGGQTFHSARWRHDTDVRGKDVAVIGTGASGVQIVPELAGRARRLYVFQRTAPWILPKEDRAITELERALFRRVPAVQRLARAAIYARFEARALAFIVEPRLGKLGEREALAHLAKAVKDPVLREKLTPKYRLGCKRVLLSSDYFEALQRPGVELVTEAIDRFDEGAIVTADETRRKLDAVVLATGFHAADLGAPFPVRGRGGRSLDDVWANGAEAYLGTAVHGFPNLFFIVGPNTGLGHNSMVFMIECQAQYVLGALKHMRARGIASTEVREQAQRRYNEEIQARFPGTVWNSGCKSWYTTTSGKNTTLFPGFTLEFRHRTRRFDPAVYAETHLTSG